MLSDRAVVRELHTVATSTSAVYMCSRCFDTHAPLDPTLWALNCSASRDCVELRRAVVENPETTVRHNLPYRYRHAFSVEGFDSLSTHSWMRFCARAWTMAPPFYHTSFSARLLHMLSPSLSGSTSSALATREAMQVWESCWRVLLCGASTTES